MATPTDFPQVNVRLGKPEGMTDAECTPLPAHRSLQPRCFVSCWRPTVEDLERLVRGAPIWVYVYGDGHPPLAVTTEDPFSG